jgi:hypothetical protein
MVSFVNPLPDAVRVTSRMNEKRENSLKLFFAPMLGKSTSSLETSAIAVIGRGTPRDIMLVIDCSTSMSSYSRMTYTRQAALLLIDEIGETDRLALTVYCYPQTVLVPKDPDSKKPKFETQTIKTGYLERELTFNHDMVRSRVPQLVPGLYTEGTNIAGGMRVGLDHLRLNRRIEKDIPVQQYLVLMTDGHANIAEAPGTMPKNSIDHYTSVAKLDGVIIHGITLGSNADQASIKQAAGVTGGEYFHVVDGNYQQLFEAYRRIGRGDGKPKLVR